jgi:hypothetical protein
MYIEVTQCEECIQFIENKKGLHNAFVGSSGQKEIIGFSITSFSEVEIVQQKQLGALNTLSVTIFVILLHYFAGREPLERKLEVAKNINHSHC